MGNKTEPSETMKTAREQGFVPDLFWYQTNGKSAQENYQEQKERIIENALASFYEKDETPEIKITSEVKKK